MIERPSISTARWIAAEQAVTLAPDLADAHVYLDPKNDKAPLAVDLLLGARGYRELDLLAVAAQHHL